MHIKIVFLAIVSPKAFHLIFSMVFYFFLPSFLFFFKSENQSAHTGKRYVVGRDLSRQLEVPLFQPSLPLCCIVSHTAANPHTRTFNITFTEMTLHMALFALVLPLKDRVPWRQKLFSILFENDSYCSSMVA